LGDCEPAKDGHGAPALGGINAYGGGTQEIAESHRAAAANTFPVFAMRVVERVFADQSRTDREIISRFGNSMQLQTTCANCVGCLGDLLPPSPPGEKAAKIYHGV